MEDGVHSPFELCRTEKAAVLERSAVEEKWLRAKARMLKGSECGTYACLTAGTLLEDGASRSHTATAVGSCGALIISHAQLLAERYRSLRQHKSIRRLQRGPVSFGGI